MGHSITPKYVLIIDGQMDLPWTGRPSLAALKVRVLALGRSMNPGGANAHLTNRDGSIPYPRRAVIRENRLGGQVVADWTAPPFMIW